MTRKPTTPRRNIGWMEDATCAGQSVELFYSFESTTSDRVLAAYARQLCRACPVATHCLDHALATGEAHGIWGGLNPKERKAHARRTRKQQEG